MQVRNNYELDIFNGDLGRVLSFDPEERELVVDFDGRPVVIPSEDLEDVVPAYACTIHKSQGSEYPAVVIVLHHQHHVMLQRNLLYTAITRGRRLVVIVGSKRALARAVNNATVRKRYTLLADRLRNEKPVRYAGQGSQRAVKSTPHPAAAGRPGIRLSCSRCRVVRRVPFGRSANPTARRRRAQELEGSIELRAVEAATGGPGCPGTRRDRAHARGRR